MNPFHEPDIDPLADTNPALIAVPDEDEPAHDEAPSWRKVVGWLSLLGALVFTLLAIVIALIPRPQPAPELVAAPTQVLPASPVPTEIITQPTQIVAPVSDGALPTIDAQTALTLLQTPVVQRDQDRSRIVPAQYDPFTIVPDRPRSIFIQYQAVQGDTLNAIAERYGLTSESLAWCNNRRVIFTLRPGDVLDIPPTDGACHQVLGTREESIGDVAAQYAVDPSVLIESPFNNLYGRPVDYVLPGGANLFIPGGQGPLITWNPGYEEGDDGTGVRTATFAPGQPGSCGPVAGGGTLWGNPLPTGVWMRGFFAGHTGIDLAAPTGTPVYAANGGPVMFAGWSRWGYGNSVVLAHGGSTSTLYAHMSQISVGCGQVIATGQVVGLVGSTGNSSGPHLHFEIRSGDTPLDPTGTAGIGW